MKKSQKTNTKNLKKKNILFYLPNGIMIPEIHVMTSLIQNYLDVKKHNVSILTCGGEKNFSCSLNVYGINEICKACISRRNLALSKLNGTFKVTEIKKKYKFPNKIKLKNISDLEYENIDFGLGLYSSYTNSTRDSFLNGKKSIKTIRRLLDTSFSFYKFFQEFSNKQKIDEFIIYNSRMSEKRPLFRFAIKKNINVSNYEKLTVGKFFNFKDHFSEDRKFRKNQILKFLKSTDQNFEKEKKYFTEKFYSKKDPINFEIYAKHQKPINKKWSSGKKYCFFHLSDDEHCFGKDKNLHFVKTKEILKETSLIINKKF